MTTSSSAERAAAVSIPRLPSASCVVAVAIVISSSACGFPLFTATQPCRGIRQPPCRCASAVDLSQSELRIGDEPTFRCDLVLNEVIFRPRAANPRPAFPRRVHEVQIVGNLRDEVVDIGVPIAVERSGEEQSRVVVQEYEAHVVERADLVRTG